MQVFIITFSQFFYIEEVLAVAGGKQLTKSLFPAVLLLCVQTPHMQPLLVSVNLPIEMQMEKNQGLEEETCQGFPVISRLRGVCQSDLRPPPHLVPRSLYSSPWHQPFSQLSRAGSKQWLAAQTSRPGLSLTPASSNKMASSVCLPEKWL